MKKGGTLLNIKEIKIDKSLFPRDKLDKDTIDRYRAALDVLPPILLGKDKTLIDGWHRLEAHKLEKQTKILVEYTDVPPEEYFIEANRCNARHGNPMKAAERRRNAMRLFLRHGLTGDEIADVIGISKRHGRRLVEAFSKAKRELRNKVVVDLVKRGLTYRDIEKETGVSKSHVPNIIKTVQEAQSQKPVAETVVADDSEEGFEEHVPDAEAVIPEIAPESFDDPVGAITTMRNELAKIGIAAPTYDGAMIAKTLTALGKLEATCTVVTDELLKADEDDIDEED